MNRLIHYITILLLTLSCNSLDQKGLKTLDTGKFEIVVPNDWQYIKQQGIDSFIGKIKSDDIELFFDYSEAGFASHLISSEHEYVYEETWRWEPSFPYAEPGVTYTQRDNVERVRKRKMKEQGITDSSLIKVEPVQHPKINIETTDSNYRATLTYLDTVVAMMIEIPDEIKDHRITIDTIGSYTRKIIQPKMGRDGMTGVYFEDLHSDFNFQINGEGLDSTNQQKALRAFKTIKIKREE